jgi:hypothetical protein
MPHLWLLAMTLLMTACTTSAKFEADRLFADVVSASRKGLACRYSVASNPRYQLIAAHMPLVAVYRASLVQMTDTRLATDDEIQALALWSKEACVAERNRKTA